MPAPTFPAGRVTGLGVRPPGGTPPPAAPPATEPPPPPRRGKIAWFVVLAVAVLLAGIGVVIANGTDGEGLFESRPPAPVDDRPPLARACPPPEDVPNAPPAAPGPAIKPNQARTVDAETGISYNAYGAPWRPWNTVWSAGELEVPYRIGQHFVTEETPGYGTYHASILSAPVPAALNDAYTFDLECVGRQVAADARAEYYPQPTELEPVRDEMTTIGGRPAWLTVFRLHFQREGLRATNELVGLACIDVGKPTAAVLYVSIPGTHRQFDWVVDDVMNSVQVI